MHDPPAPQSDYDDDDDDSQWASNYTKYKQKIIKSLSISMIANT